MYLSVRVKLIRGKVRKTSACPCYITQRSCPFTTTKLLARTFSTRTRSLTYANSTITTSAMLITTVWTSCLTRTDMFHYVTLYTIWQYGLLLLHYYVQCITICKKPCQWFFIYFVRTNFNGINKRFSSSKNVALDGLRTTVSRRHN